MLELCDLAPFILGYGAESEVPPEDLASELRESRGPGTTSMSAQHDAYQSSAITASHLG